MRNSLNFNNNNWVWKTSSDVFSLSLSAASADISGFSVHNIKNIHTEREQASKAPSTLWWPRKALGNFPRKQKLKRNIHGMLKSNACSLSLIPRGGVQKRLKERNKLSDGIHLEAENSKRKKSIMEGQLCCNFPHREARIDKPQNNSNSTELKESSKRITARNFNYRSIYGGSERKNEKKYFRQLLIGHFPYFCVIAL